MDQDSECARVVDEHWATFVQRVKMVMPIVDELRSRGMLEWEPYCKISTADTNQKKMRELYEVLHSGGDKVKSAFYSQLERQEPCLFRDLGFTGHHTHFEKTQTPEISSVILKYKKQICSEYQYVTEYNSLPGEYVLLSERYTQPLILQTHRDQQERQEELCSSGERFQQVLSSRNSHESSYLNSLFNPGDHRISPSAIILQGNSGNGKTLTVQKIMLDWASDDLYKEQFDVVFHLKCKEINCISGTKSLVEILSNSCSLTSDQISQIIQHSPEKVLFIIDGFDELRLTQDIYHMSPNTDPIQKAPPEVTLCALLRGQILPESFLLVTTRSTATDTLGKLLKGPQRFTEIMGFSEMGVEEYFQKFFQNEELFRKAYEYVKANETLITACSIPVICWIICTTIKERFEVGADVTSGLETTTSIYFDFVSTLLEHHCQGLSQSAPSLLRSLGQLAERGMLEEQVLFDEESVNEMVSDPAGNPFLCKFLFKRRISQETMFSFMHLSFQEFFTALYYVLLEEEESQRKVRELLSKNSSEYSPYAHPPRFAAVVQFAFGLLNKDVRRTLRKKHGLVVHPNAQTHLKKWILEEFRTDYPIMDRTLFWLHCLYELHEADFVKEVMEARNKISLSDVSLKSIDCWALLYCSQCCHSMNELYITDSALTCKTLSMILPALPNFKNLTFHLVDLSDSFLVELMCALVRRQTLSSLSLSPDSYTIGCWSCSVSSLDLSLSEEICSICISTFCEDAAPSFLTLSLTLPRSVLISIDWTNIQILHQRNLDALMHFLSSFSELKKLKLKIGCLTKKCALWTLQIIQNLPSVTELLVDADFLLEEVIKVLQRSYTRPACIMGVHGFICNKQSQKCTNHNDWHRRCNQKVTVHLNSQGFSMENERTPLFWD
ncbi:NACHT, LRR and PYD domains-containing protein 3-like [Sinocyclocheilus rhinocerous]|uniref:NACHT, LRR and PYD domains-containing protein 3-like n=1 Tax=Sinocyclocheilus rhinocerous TaxID=307959 RepID=UPI0007BA0147|nr:PREDICTED: NACHT, LRR and PYD domains-containing protein 3-like [Sinocyclocheilus rhinocerous]